MRGFDVVNHLIDEIMGSEGPTSALSTEILRNWTDERINEFAKHLLECRECRATAKEAGARADNKPSDEICDSDCICHYCIYDSETDEPCGTCKIRSVNFVGRRLRTSA